MFPLARVPFWYRFFDPQPYDRNLECLYNVALCFAVVVCLIRMSRNFSESGVFSTSTGVCGNVALFHV